jgi:branched-chain amino acid transport system substrate-binding protein
MLKRLSGRGLAKFVKVASLAMTAGLAMTIGMTAVSSTSAGAASKSSPFTVLMPISQSGALSGYGLAELAGMRAGAAYLNAHGGILGHKIKLVALNDNSDPTTAVSVVLNYLSSNPKPNAIWSGTESAQVTALLPIITERGIFSEGLTDVTNLFAHASKYPDQFVVGPTATQLSQSELAYAKAKGYTKVGLLIENDAFSEGQATTLEALSSHYGVNLTEVTFAGTALDVTPELSQLQSDNVQALMVSAPGPSGGYVLAGRAKLGWKVPVIGDLTLVSDPLAQDLPAADLAGVVGTDTPNGLYRTTSKLPTGDRELLKGLNSEGATINQGLNLYSQPWDGLMVINHAAKQAGSISESALVKALNHLKTATDPNYATFPEIKYTPTDHENVGGDPSGNYPLISVGTFIDGMLKPLP